MKERGITLPEILSVISIVGVLTASMTYSYQDWSKKYRIEKVTKELYTDLMSARLMAVTRNLEHYAVLGSTSYSIIEDTDDSCTQNAGDTVLASYPRSVDYTISRNGVGNKVIFDKQGLVTPNRTVWIASSADPDYDCIKISRSRIIMGKHDGHECRAK